MDQRNDRSGIFLRLPYDFSNPTKARFKQRLCDPDKDRGIVPHVFGRGFTINLHALLRRVRLIR